MFVASVQGRQQKPDTIKQKEDKVPCDTITKMLVEVGKMDPEAVIRALAAEGITAKLNGGKVYWTFEGRGHSYDPVAGKVEASGRYIEADEVTNLKQVYGKQIVRDQAKKFGWQLTPLGNNKFKVVKRY